jgi:pyridoxal phosphate enzyme (YggS family)
MYQAIAAYASNHGVTLVAVSKTRSIEELMPLYQEGQRAFGENRVQELLTKYEGMPKDIQWHLIGHLQSNKVKYIAPFIHTIHSVDSVSLLETIQREAEKHQRKIRVLLQFHIAEEETKFGLDEEEGIAILEKIQSSPLPNVDMVGVMGMATLTEDVQKIRNEFTTLKGIYTRLKQAYFENQASFCEISMGMSSDYEIAVEEGATIIRVGSALFV